MIVMNPLTGDVEGELVAGTSHALLALGGGGSVGGRTGDQGGELKIIATVKGQFDDTPIFNDGAQGSGFAFDDGGSRSYFDGFGDVSDLHGDVDFGDLAGLEFETIAHLGAKPGLFGADVVDARGQRRSAIESELVGLNHALDVGRRVGDGDFGSGDDGTGRVGDGAFDFARWRLGQGAGGKQENWN